MFNRAFRNGVNFLDFRCALWEGLKKKKKKCICLLEITKRISLSSVNFVSDPGYIKFNSDPVKVGVNFLVTFNTVRFSIIKSY